MEAPSRNELGGRHAIFIFTLRGVQAPLADLGSWHIASFPCAAIGAIADIELHRSSLALGFGMGRALQHERKIARRLGAVGRCVSGTHSDASQGLRNTCFPCASQPRFWEAGTRISPYRYWISAKPVRFTSESGHSRARSPQARFCAINGRVRGPDSNNGGRAGKNSE